MKNAYLQIFRIQDPESSGYGDPAGKSQEGLKKSRKQTPPNEAILRPYETLVRVSETKKYFLGYFLIFDVFPMYFPM